MVCGPRWGSMGFHFGTTFFFSWCVLALLFLEAGSLFGDLRMGLVCGSDMEGPNSGFFETAFPPIKGVLVV